MDIPAKLLRIIDANLNRTGEGLRFLEEIARLGLDDADLTRKLKNLRHELLTGGGFSDRDLVAARDAGSDVGAEIEEETARELSGAVVANARRVQQSLRVLEELSKLPELSGWDATKFKRARFALYTIEKEILSGLTSPHHGHPAKKSLKIKSTG
ncbi:MAG: thiamine-phosphate pyrophosphorylase [Dehalococcoidia bacterium]|nr:MAG: thiamine-phosphate pyrophosphorylase [Dehalococcoidia bacterium]